VDNRFIELKSLPALAFRTEKNWYIYDRFSNSILKVEKIIVDLIEDIGVLSLKEIKEKHKIYNYEDIEKAAKEIEDMKQKNIFIKYEVPKLSITNENDPKGYLEKKLESSLTQLILNITEDCNLRCEYCIYSGSYIDKRTHNNLNDMPLNIAKRAVDFFLSRSQESLVRYISFYGGEPLLKFSLIKAVIEYARKLDSNIRFSLSTNGTLLNEQIMEFMADKEIDIQISLDGPQAIHDKYRKLPNGSGTFNMIKKNILNMKENFPRLYAKLSINSVIVPHDCSLDDINFFFSNSELLENIHFDKIMMKPINPDKNKFYNKYSYREFLSDLYNKLFDIYKKDLLGSTMSEKSILPKVLLERTIKRILFRPRKPFSAYLFYWPNGICIPGMRSLFVSSDGSFFPCEKFYDENDLRIGDIYRGFYYGEILKLIEDYCALALTECKKCWAFRFCDDCFLSAREKQDFNILRKREFCNAKKLTIAFFLLLFVEILEENPKAFDYLLTEPFELPSYVKMMFSNEYDK
jgi:uncharacterized protein